MPAEPRPYPRVLAVVPAFNEEESVGRTIEELTSVNPGIDVLVVDDGSGDHTARVARRAGAIVCQLPYNLGVGGAMRAGYRYALRHDYDVAVQVDADGQHDPTYLKALVDELDAAGIVVGARFAGEGDSFTGFSTAPLRVATALGVGGALVAMLFAAYVVVNRLVGNPVPGWASTVVIVMTMGAVQLLCLGLLGEYIGRMYTQMQGRPAYYVAYDSAMQVDDPEGVRTGPAAPTQH